MENNSPKEPSIKIRLAGGAVVEIPRKFKYSKCKGCQANDLIWATTKNGKSMPIRWNKISQSWVSHFSDCVSADKFRKDK